MPSGSPLHIAIIRFVFTTLENEIKAKHLPFEIFPGGIGVRTGLRTSREPDLCILHRADWDALRKQNPLSAIVERLPLLVIEVVSPGKIAIATITQNVASMLKWAFLSIGSLTLKNKRWCFAF